MIVGIIVVFASAIVPELIPSWIGYALLLLGGILVVFKVMLER